MRWGEGHSQVKAPMEFVLAVSAGCSGLRMCSSARTEQQSRRWKQPKPRVMPTKPAVFLTVFDLK